MFGLSRRRVLQGVAGAAALAPLVGCGTEAQRGSFPQGVASGDPLPDRVILWTRFLPDVTEQKLPQEVAVAWQIASDEGFSNIISSGTASANADRDYTVKVDATGLTAGTRYLYRFMVGDQISPVGQTRTAPEGAVDRLSLAVVSCSNLPYGYFNAYADIAQRADIDLVVHLGDYLYEYGRGGYSRDVIEEKGRVVFPEGEMITLDDYRLRYATYRNDPDLQAVHARHPFIVVWDDHEITNDSWTDGAQNHDDSEGDFAVRRAAAARAYREWMPIRDVPGTPNDQIYRSFDWGNLVSLIMLDTRIIGRNEQLDYRRDLTYVSAPFDISDPENPKQIEDISKLAELPGDAVKTLPIPFDMTQSPPAPVTDAKAIAAFDPTKPTPGLSPMPDVKAFRETHLDRPERTLLGADQESWLDETLEQSVKKGVRWQVLGQQVLVGNRGIPPNVGTILETDRKTYIDGPTAQLLGLLTALGLPMNMDSWNGYGAARARLLQSLETKAANAIILSGDTHNAWAFELTNDDDAPIAAEFATPGVTSPGLEFYFPAKPEALAPALVATNPELKWCNTKDRGYVALTLTPDDAQCEFVILSNTDDRNYETTIAQQISLAPQDAPGVGPLVLNDGASG
ncbi:MAG: alkaline phosphatase D family protein [Pseudomonadota bacterium]